MCIRDRDEDWEFTENIDEILDVPGIDAINFGPVDYAVSKGLPVGYSMSPEVHDAFKVLVEKAQKKGLGILGPVVPPTAENMRKGIEDGFNMIIVGNDMWHFTTSMKDMMKNHVNVLRKELCK